MIRANEVVKNEPADMSLIKFNFNDKPNNELDKIKNDILNLRNFGVSSLIIGAVGSALSLASAVAIAGYFYYYALIPTSLLPFFGFMLVLGILINANSRRYLNKGRFIDSIDDLKKAGIILTSIFGSLTLCGIAVGILYYIFYYNLLGANLLLPATMGVLFLSFIVPLVFFICALPMMITGIIFSNLKKRASAISYLDTERFAFTNGFSIRF
ncbi:MAG: hypothetical protein JXB50_16675 [Spirochaetes bacterium]|nr:hypothetical protein [Spirochaetota bacterium]